MCARARAKHTYCVVGSHCWKNNNNIGRCGARKMRERARESERSKEREREKRSCICVGATLRWRAQFTIDPDDHTRTHYTSSTLYRLAHRHGHTIMKVYSHDGWWRYCVETWLTEENQKRNDASTSLPGFYRLVILDASIVQCVFFFFLFLFSFYFSSSCFSLSINLQSRPRFLPWEEDGQVSWFSDVPDRCTSTRSISNSSAFFNSYWIAKRQ